MTHTEQQIDRHLRLWTEKLGPDSPEASIVRQLRAERDAAREDANALKAATGWTVFRAKCTIHTGEQP